jgi:Rad3-related DNA helicase
MNRAEIDTTLPKMVEIVRQLLELHKGEKGIIHATSHKVARFIKERVKDPRILYRDDGDRDAMLREHISRTDASVMISPSMTEGVDLVDDLSRFQVFVKIPFPNLGDAVVSKRMQLDAKWYALETTRTMVQGVGRSIRNMEDKATTYILDGSFEYFYEKNKEMFPQSFRKSLDMSKK